LNSDPFKAVTGTPFGGITYIGRGGAQGILVPGNKDLLPPLGDAHYSYFDRDVAETFGGIDFRASSADNPLVIKTDEEWGKLLIKAKALYADLDAKNLAGTQAEIKKVRDYVEKTLGHDGIVIAKDPRLGGTAVLEKVFTYDQLIAFNPKNSVPVKDPKTRSKKIQTKILKMVDPPANPVKSDECLLLLD
jgi:hypothetical protein